MANSVGIIFFIFLPKTLQIVWIVSYLASGIKIFNKEIFISFGDSFNNFLLFSLSIFISEIPHIISLISFFV
jgi:hypothetical protein